MASLEIVLDRVGNVYHVGVRSLFCFCHILQEVVKGTVRADYFFGKPVSDARVVVKVSTFDVGFNEIANIQGRTDAAGVFEFEQTLPEHFVGLPLEQGDAFVQFEVSVIDQADHKEGITQQRTVAAQPIRITVIPESGEIVSGVENILYVMTTYPDGRAAKCVLSVPLRSAPWYTDDLGIAEVKVPAGGVLLPLEQGLQFHAEDDQGHYASLVWSPMVGPEKEGLLLRTDEALYKVGDEMRLTALTPAKKGTIYFDVIKDRQTMLTQAQEIEGGKAETSVTLTPDLTGTLEIHAYRIRPDGNIVRDTKIVYVSSADDLSIEVKAHKDTYLPGGEATLSFQVSDAKGHPALAALGLSIVDEAVFALQEMQPGLEKVFFTLEKELLEPRYEIHGYEPGYVIRPGIRGEISPEEAIARKRQAAKVLFAAAEPLTSFTLKGNSYANRAERMKERWAKEMAADIKEIGKAVEQWHEDKEEYPEADKGLRPLLEAGTVPVVTGFIGATAAGVQTTLGRGSSDYTATILGNCLAAEEVWIWSDVDGVMTADPRIVPDARTLPSVTYAEVAELSFFGAKVLHPRTIQPVAQKKIPVRVLNSLKPEHPGTTIGDTPSNSPFIKGITAIRELSLVTVQGPGMQGVPGIAGRVFSAVGSELLGSASCFLPPQLRATAAAVITPTLRARSSSTPLAAILPEFVARGGAVGPLAAAADSDSDGDRDHAQGMTCGEGLVEDEVGPDAGQERDRGQRQ